jgi:hypothetical protein
MDLQADRGWATLGRPASISESVRSRRSAREAMMVRAPRPNPLGRRVGPAGDARPPTDQALQDDTDLPPADAAPAAPDPRLGGRELHDRRVRAAARGSRGTRRTQSGCSEQTNGERQWNQAVAGAVHGSRFPPARERNVESG